MSLQQRIMNLPFTEPADVSAYRPEFASKIGHRDARHAAAELAAPYDALIEQMAKALRVLVDRNFTFFSGGMIGADKKITREEVLAARAALAKHAELCGSAADVREGGAG